MKTKEIIKKIDLGQAIVVIGVGMNNNGHYLTDSDWLRDDDTVWDYCGSASDYDMAAIRDALKDANNDNDDWDPDNWLVFGRSEINAEGYLTGIESRYASYIG